MPLDMRAMCESLKVEVACAENGPEVEAQWRDLEQHGTCTVFQSRAWLLPWYRLVAPGLKAEMILITVREGSGRAVMFLPLCRRRRHGVSAVEFADGGLSDYVAPVMAKELSQQEFGEIWTLILSRLPKSDLIRFEKIPEFVSGCINPITSLPWVYKMDNYAAWGCSLPSSREEYDKTLRARDSKRNPAETEEPDCSLGRHLPYSRKFRLGKEAYFSDFASASTGSLRKTRAL